jgi:hypothetical protein
MGSIAVSKKKQVINKQFISWFEIPALNFQAAVLFYNTIFGMEMETFSRNEHAIAVFPNKNGIGGAVVCGPGSLPNENGPLLYLNANPDLNNVLNKVVDSGGRLIMPKTFINKESGFFALFIDSEGNKMALHSDK